MKSILSLMFLIHALMLSAQQHEYGNVSVEELQQKFSPLDSTAPAAILYKKGKTYFELKGLSWILITDVEIRIKIYNTEGYSYANEEFDYYTGDNDIIYSFSDACTYNLGENGTVIKTPAGPEGYFAQEVNKYRKVKKLIMPNVKEGSVIEYKYKIQSRYYSRFKDWYFQYAIPANSIEYEVAIPDFFTYRSFIKGKVNIQQTKPRIHYSKTYGENKVTYSAKNIKPLKGEGFVNNIKNYLAVLSHELVSADYQKGEFVDHISTDWKSLAVNLNKVSVFGEQLNQKQFFKKVLNDFMPEGFVPPQKRIELIYAHVKDRMLWDGFTDYYCYREVRDSYNSKSGNIADINLLLTGLLRESGINANPILISTRAHGLAIYPSVYAYNYVIAGIETGDKVILLDASDKNLVKGLLPVKALNWTGRMIKQDGTTKEVNLVPENKSREVITVSADIANDGTVTGKVRNQYLDYKALQFREEHEISDKDECVRALEKMHKGTQIDNYNLKSDKAEEPIVEEYHFENTTQADVMGDKMYISPMLFYTNLKNPFQSETRDYPIDFIFPFENKYIFILNLPVGYSIASLPESNAFIADKGIAGFKYNISSNGRQIQLSVAYDVNYAVIAQEDYAAVKDFFRQMIEKQNEKIVLKRI